MLLFRYNATLYSVYYYIPLYSNARAFLREPDQGAPPGRDFARGGRGGGGGNYSPLLSLAQRVVATSTSTCVRAGRRPKLPRFTKWRCVAAPALVPNSGRLVFQELIENK